LRVVLIPFAVLMLPLVVSKLIAATRTIKILVAVIILDTVVPDIVAFKRSTRIATQFISG